MILSLPNEKIRSFAVGPDAKQTFVGTSLFLHAFDQAGANKWFRRPRDEVWAVNATGDGRLVVAAEGDGTIRWYRADDGRELLALQVLANNKDWVFWDSGRFL